VNNLQKKASINRIQHVVNLWRFNSKRRHINVIIGTEEFLTNIIFLIDICLFNICFKLNIWLSTQHYNTTFVNSLGSQNVL
jgi:hypothetical protein